MEGRKSKCYKILSFKYDFIFEGDTVQFAYCLPYSYEKLNNFLKTINSSKVRTIIYQPAQSQVPWCYSNEEDRVPTAIVN